MRQASDRSLWGRHSLALGDLEASQRTMSELQRLKGLLPPEMQSWVFVEAAAAVEPPLITLEEIGRDEVEIQVDLDQWDSLALDHRNLLFWHEVGRSRTTPFPAMAGKWQPWPLASVAPSANSGFKTACC